VASDFDRDNSIDALLQGARRNPAAVSHVETGPACLDAETLAAWAEGGLDADRVRLIETHVADCARCQALSAAFFSSDETVTEGVPKVVRFRRNRVMYWAPIAAGTIAATLVIWIGVRDQDELKSEAQAVIAESRAAQTPSAAVDERRLPDKQGQQGNVTAPDSSRLQRKESAASANQSRALAADAAAPQAAARAAAEPVASPAPARPMTPLAAPPPPPAVVVPPVTTTASGVGAGAAGAAAGGVRQTAELLEKLEPRVIAEFSSVLARSSTIGGLPPAGAIAGGAAGGGAGRGGRGGGAGGAGAGRGAGVVLDGVAVAPPFYWRILATDVIERSLDRLVWEAVAIDPPVQGLAGGVAPAATVCWIIGRAGLVLVTTDGKEFTRVTQPAPVDLISITAHDAMRATVTTAGGQTFTTADGGKTWK
jgi:hypothetical protein